MSVWGKCIGSFLTISEIWYIVPRANVPPFPGDIGFCLDKYAVEDWLYVVYLWHSQAQRKRVDREKEK